MSLALLMSESIWTVPEPIGCPLAVHLDNVPNDDTFQDNGPCPSSESRALSPKSLDGRLPAAENCRWNLRQLMADHMELGQTCHAG